MALQPMDGGIMSSTQWFPERSGGQPVAFNILRELELNWVEMHYLLLKREEYAQNPFSESLIHFFNYVKS